jgi:hypothetical protein
MSDEPRKPYLKPWQWVTCYAFITAFSAWAWSRQMIWLIGPPAPYIGGVLGIGIAYLIHREAEAGRMD